MEGVKGLLQSKTFWGIIVVVLVPVLRKIGVDVDDVAGTALASDLVTLAGALLAVYGRVVAAKKVGDGTIKTTLIGGAK